MIRVAVLAMAALALVGCASSEQIAAADQAQCQQRGLRPGSDEFANCMARLAADREDMRRQAISSNPAMGTLPALPRTCVPAGGSVTCY